MTSAPTLQVDLPHPSTKPGNGLTNGSLTPREGENQIPNGVSILSPKKPNLHRAMDASDIPNDEISTDVLDIAEKTNHWASLCFGAAIVFFGLACYDGYYSLNERSFSLLIRGVAWVVISTIIGTVGEILQKATRVEPSVIPSADSTNHGVLVEGQFPGMPNVGNTCFINAPTQAIMNDSAYPRDYKEICENAKKRHEIFKKFLDLFQKSFSPLEFIFGAKETTQHLVVENTRDVIAMLTMVRSNLNFDSQGFREKYPTIHGLINQFSRVTKYADFPEVSDSDPELRKEFGKMRDDKKIVDYFLQERSNIPKVVLGFESFHNLITAYETAVNEKSVVVSLGWRASSIGNIRNLIRNAGGYSQEDVDELLHCLSRFILPDDYPEVFFTVDYERTWVECLDQNQEELARFLELHQNPRHSGDILTELPANNTLVTPELQCILQIKGFLTANADGQTLIDDLFQSKRSDLKTTMVFLDQAKQPKKYCMVDEKIVIPPNRTPQRVIFELVRHEWNEAEHRRKKINCVIHMPEQAKIGGHSYRLNSIVRHSGGAEGGHYDALLNKQGQWWYASDSTVKNAVPKHVEDALELGYLYFYEKIVQV